MPNKIYLFKIINFIYKGLSKELYFVARGFQKGNEHFFYFDIFSEIRSGFLILMQTRLPDIWYTVMSASYYIPIK